MVFVTFLGAVTKYQIEIIWGGVGRFIMVYCFSAQDAAAWLHAAGQLVT